jgi:hypothetical protein
MVGAIEEAIQALLADSEQAQADVLQRVKRRIIKAT